MVRGTLLFGMVLITLLAAACGPARAPAPAAAPAAPASPLVNQAMPAAAQPTTAPAAAAQPAAQPGQAPEPPAGAGAVAAAGQVASLDMAGVSPYEGSRKIIKNGEMRLLVENTDRALDQATSIAVDNGGYIIASESTMQEGFKTAMLNLGVPVERFEEVQRRLRGLALQVLNDTASGQDVTDEYVDLQSRLANQEATAARVRQFLAQAKTVEEALRVNAQLAEIEGTIEQIKGRMTYLKDRASYSTLRVDLEPQRPTPTPTFTPVPTATPTPIIWRPGETFHHASGALGTVGRTLGDATIWLVVVFGPFLLVALALAFAWRQWGPGRRQA
jgi:hypothetical protein